MVETYKMKKTKIKLGNNAAYKYTWTDANGLNVAQFEIWDWWDGKNMSNFEIFGEYKGKGLSYEFLDYATKNLAVKNLAVSKDNSIAKHIYIKFGFKITDQDNQYFYMSLSA